jgi:REP element-mobilizing transposase RayT
LRSDNAKGDISFRHPRHFEKVNSKVRRVAAKYGVKIHDYANVGNHLHVLLQAPGRTIWNRFIRELTSKIMAIVTERSGRAQRRRRFWTHRPFTRVVRGWGRAWRAIKNYIALNRLEGAGKISRWTPPRKKREGYGPRGPSS